MRPFQNDDDIHSVGTWQSVAIICTVLGFFGFLAAALLWLARH